MYRVKHRGPSVRLAASISIGLATLISCSSPAISDDAMIGAFNRNRVFFEQVVEQSRSIQLVCPDHNDRNICQPKDASELQAKLRQQLGFPVERIYVDVNRSDSLWIPVQTTGYLSISSSTRGYVYCKCQLTPVTKDTLSEEAHGYSFRPINNGWMLFVAN